MVVANSKGLSLAVFTAQRKEPRVLTMLDNSSHRTITDSRPATTDVTRNAGNAAGAALHEASMARLAATQALFQKPAAEVAGAAGQQRSMTEVFKPLSRWTEKQDKQWKEDLV